MTQQRDLIEELINVFQRRRERGLQTYGVTVDPSSEDVEFWLKEAVDEGADWLIYSYAALERVRWMQGRVAELESALVDEKEQHRRTQAELATTQRRLADAEGFN